jgi:hypothetical protein
LYLELKESVSFEANPTYNKEVTDGGNINGNPMRTVSMMSFTDY